MKTLQLANRNSSSSSRSNRVTQRTQKNSTLLIKQARQNSVLSKNPKNPWKCGIPWKCGATQQITSSFS